MFFCALGTFFFSCVRTSRTSPRSPPGPAGSSSTHPGGPSSSPRLLIVCWQVGNRRGNGSHECASADPCAQPAPVLRGDKQHRQRGRRRRRRRWWWWCYRRRRRRRRRRRGRWWCDLLPHPDRSEPGAGAAGRRRAQPQSGPGGGVLHRGPEGKPGPAQT